MPDLDSLTADQRLALLTAAKILQKEFAGVFSTETIELFLQTSYDQFADRAKFTNFLPLMAERFARQRLTALARVEGKHSDGTPIVLFLCVHNAGRSQMALGWFNRLIGINPAGEAFEFAVNVLNDAEFAGATFSHDGEVLFVNVFGDGTPGSGMTCAITGPWRRGAL